MTTIATIITTVEGITGRTDKTTLITSAVKASILAAHSGSYLDRGGVSGPQYFSQDRIEAEVTPGAAAKKITQSLPTRFRKYCYILPIDSDSIALHRGFTRKDPADVFSFEQISILEIYYIVGQNVKIVSNSVINKLKWCYYEYPDVTNTANTTWLADQYEQAIEDRSCAYVYRKLGEARLAKEYMDSWREQAIQIVGDNLIEDV